MMKPFFILLLFSSTVFSQIINFPDANFKSKLLSAEAGNGTAYLCNGNSFTLDMNNDGEIEVSEALMVCSLAISNSNISDLTGLEYFTNLDHLQCNNNAVTELDLSSLTNLVGININNNQLTSLNVSGLTEVQGISCTNNQLTSLDVSGLINLNVLNIANNQLTSLNIDDANNLQYIYVQNNLLNSLDISNQPEITFLNCSSNNLTSLNVKNGSGEPLLFDDNPNLEYICADAEQLNHVEDKIIEYGLINCFTNSLCSYSSGEDYYTIYGNVKYDENLDGCDSVDIDYPLLRLTLSDGTNNGDVLADESGDYHYLVQEGSYTITPQVENTVFFTVNPSQVIVEFPSQSSPFEQNFCLEPNGEHPDLDIRFYPLAGTINNSNDAYPGAESSYRIIFSNKGNMTQSGSIQLIFDDEVSDFVSSTLPISNAGENMLEWDFSDLHPFESREIEFTLYINGPSDNPPLNEGDFIHYTASLITDEIDETPADNTVSITQLVSFVILLNTVEYTFSDYFTLYPNPVEEILNIDVRLGIEIESMGVYNISGQLVSLLKDQNTFSMDVSSFQSGTYFIKIQTNKGVFNSQFIRK